MSVLQAVTEEELASLSGKTVIITGGASGIGRAAVHLAHGKGDLHSSFGAGSLHNGCLYLLLTAELEF